MAVTYAHDIRPKFRVGDVGCMTPRGIRLADAHWMCNPEPGEGVTDHANARKVYAALSAGLMPPDEKWSQQWLDTYQAWMSDGFQP